MYELIIAGTPRSGTYFTSDLLTQAGIICNHEAFYGLAGYGVMRWKATAEASWLALPMLERERDRGVKIIHIVRNPLKTVSSLKNRKFLEDDQFKKNWYTFYVNNYLPLEHIKGLDRYLYFWIFWNLNIHAWAQGTVKLEWIAEDPDMMLKRLGVKEGGKYDISPKNNDKNVPQLTMKDLEGCEYKDKFLETARKFGYELE
uniref:Putative sulfotransferase domain contining protein n=1 Tax=viral metagenome TaxID=1070528 RepID=A0A6H1ZW17_9ZZZZ